MTRRPDLARRAALGAAVCLACLLPAEGTPPQAGPLEWDRTSQDLAARPGDPYARCAFQVTNRSAGDILITSIRASCGCTTASLPPLPARPFRLPAGKTASIPVTVDLRDKFGSIVKEVSVDTAAGRQVLTIRVEIPAPFQDEAVLDGRNDRPRNARIAMLDRQAVFRGGCSVCHAAPAAGKTGAALYAAACAICHDSPRRASAVPPLRNLTRRDAYFLESWIGKGREGSMMPAFGQRYGGPLSRPQIVSLMQYLEAGFR